MLVVPGGLPAQFSPCGELALPRTSPLTVSGAAALPRPIKMVVAPTLPGQPTAPGQLSVPDTLTAAMFTRFLKVTSPPELNTAKPLAAPRSDAAAASGAEMARKSTKLKTKRTTVLKIVNWRGCRLSLTTSLLGEGVRAGGCCGIARTASVKAVPTHTIARASPGREIAWGPVPTA